LAQRFEISVLRKIIDQLELKIFRDPVNYDETSWFTIVGESAPQNLAGRIDRPVAVKSFRGRYYVKPVTHAIYKRRVIKALDPPVEIRDNIRVKLTEGPPLGEIQVTKLFPHH
jgi:hypothetical protein